MRTVYSYFLKFFLIFLLALSLTPSSNAERRERKNKKAEEEETSNSLQKPPSYNPSTKYGQMVMSFETADQIPTVDELQDENLKCLSFSESGGTSGYIHFERIDKNDDRHPYHGRSEGPLFDEGNSTVYFIAHNSHSEPKIESMDPAGIVSNSYLQTHVTLKHYNWRNYNPSNPNITYSEQLGKFKKSRDGYLYYEFTTNEWKKERNDSEQDDCFCDPTTGTSSPNPTSETDTRVVYGYCWTVDQTHRYQE